MRAKREEFHRSGKGKGNEEEGGTVPLDLKNISAVVQRSSLQPMCEAVT